MAQLAAMLQEKIADPQNAWSIGTFGAIGEFMRTPEEAAHISSTEGGAEVLTSRGGMRVRARDDVQVLAYQTLSSDGETWGNSVAFCLPRPIQMEEQTIRRLGPDHDSLRPQDRAAILFDLGVGSGLISMCLRTDNAELIAALDAVQGRRLLDDEDAATAAGLILKLSPHRVMLSPLGRVEIFSSIPAEGGQSPIGPHTHFLPKLIASGRTHGANAPIPENLQPALMLHPHSPWRDLLGNRTPFNVALAENFDQILNAYGLPEDKRIHAELEAAVRGGTAPENYPWPQSRRGRAQARITLRRLAQNMEPEVLHAWNVLYDRGADDD